MSHPTTLATEQRIPTRSEALIFRFKTLLLQTRRIAADVLGHGSRKFLKTDASSVQPAIAESKTPLWTESEPEERVLLAGKIHNLRLAVQNLDGIEVGADEVFSFWKQIGRTSRFRGFVEGRELREGCIIPNVGGGLCQLSNALYDAALKADFEIVERHAHTQVITGSLAEQGRDATVFWNYVDLRFKSAKPFQIDATLDGQDLTVRFRGEKNGSGLHQITRRPLVSEHPNSCVTCEVNDCHRVVKREPNLDFGRTAFLVDDLWPEFDRYIQKNRKAADRLFLPVDGRRFRKTNYSWSTTGFTKVEQSYYITALRSYRSRKLAAQGAARQLNLLATYEKLAESYAKRLSFDVLHIVVQQNLLPYLWLGGHLGGRTFDVLMTALPMRELQKQLDLAGNLHPESKTLGDFRADERLVEAECEALKNARRILTPHTAIAELFGEKAELMAWQSPQNRERSSRKNTRRVIVFPSSTVGRKGCYELRDAIKGLDVTLITLGSDIEGKDFWSGFDVQKGGDDWIEQADLVVLPAFVEHGPRRLIAAAAAGIPVIASTACGVSNVPGIESIAAGGDAELRRHIETILSA